jgi:hypothetical protein
MEHSVVAAHVERAEVVVAATLVQLARFAAAAAQNLDAPVGPVFLGRTAVSASDEIAIVAFRSTGGS